MTESPLKISVITVSFNSASTIEQTIKSVLEQQYDNYEYIIVDGGSTDGTVDIIEKYADDLAYYVSEPDNGLYDAMNKGIANAIGDIIGIINSDDYYYPDALKTVAHSFIEHKLEDYIFWGDVMYEKQGRVMGFRPENRKIGAFAPHPSMFCPKCVYDNIGVYDTNFKLLADYDFMYRAVNKYNIKPLYETELIAFFREGGLADSNIIPCLRDELNVKLKYGQSRLSAGTAFLLKIIKNMPRIMRSRKG
jgi:glycosyltransferase involved in cell wall biosynthesis